MSDWREWVEAIAQCDTGPETGCEFALLDAHKDFVALLRVARAAKEINDKSGRVSMQVWVDLQEALKEAEHLLE